MIYGKTLKVADAGDVVEALRLDRPTALASMIVGMSISPNVFVMPASSASVGLALLARGRQGLGGLEESLRAAVKNAEELFRVFVTGGDAIEPAASAYRDSLSALAPFYNALQYAEAEAPYKDILEIGRQSLGMAIAYWNGMARDRDFFNHVRRSILEGGYLFGIQSGFNGLSLPLRMNGLVTALGETPLELDSVLPRFGKPAIKGYHSGLLIAHYTLSGNQAQGNFFAGAKTL